MGEKRVVPGPLKKVLNVDAAVTTVFCRILENYLSPTKFRTHFKALEISCHSLPWIATWVALFWILWNPNLFEMQVNFFIGLIIDILCVAIIKALVRRRRPPGNKPDMFLTVGSDIYSFPSGHVSRAVFISLFFSQLFPLGNILSLLLYTWAILVAISRVLLKRHYLLDVTGGAVLGFIEAGIVSVIWLNKSSSVSIINWLSEEKVTLEGLHDSQEIDID